MKLYYTTSAGHDERQPKPSISLGGFKSSSGILNDEFSNLFGEMSVYTIKKGKTEYIALMMVNELTTTMTNVKLWFEHPEDSYSKYQVAGLIPAINDDGDPQMERVETKYSKPLFADFVDADVDNKLDLGNIDSGNLIGLWFKREILTDYIEENYCDVYEPVPGDERNFQRKEQSQEDSIDIKISFD